MAFQVGQGIGAEGAEVGHAPAVGRHRRDIALGLVPAFQLGLLAADVVGQQADLAQALFFLVMQKAHAAGIDEQAALDPPSAGLLHAAPVAEGFGHQAPGRDRDDGLVEILHLDRVQGDVHHIAVGADLGHLDPVADPQHVVAGQLHAGDERQQGVLVDQQDHRRHGAKTRQQQQRRAVDQGGDDDDGAEHEQPHFRQLHVALDRAGPRVFGPCIDIQQGVEQGAQGQDQEQQGDGQRRVAEEQQGGLAQFRHQVQAELDHQRRRHLGQAMEHLVLVQVIEPVHRRLAPEQFGRVQDQVACHSSEQQRHHQQEHQAQAGVQQGMSVEGAPEVLGIEPELFHIHGKRGIF